MSEQKYEEYRYATSDGYLGIVKNNAVADRKHLLWYLIAQVFDQIREQKGSETSQQSKG